MTDRERLERNFREEVNLYHEQTRHQHNEDDALKSVCHVIFWACALDELHKKTLGTAYEAQRDADSHGQYLAGVRYARDRAAHQFPQMLTITGGASLPARCPVRCSTSSGVRWDSFRVPIAHIRGATGEALRNWRTDACWRGSP
jgi:hypothetical protein